MTGVGDKVTGSHEKTRRLVALVLVVGLLVGAGIVTTSVHRDRQRARTLPSAAVSYVEPYGAASSVAWYCPGPLPIGQSGEHASIAIANVSSHQVSGEITFSLSTGETTTTPMRVSGHTQAEIALPSAPSGADGAATVLLDGAGIGVSAVVSTPLGSSATPCVNHAVAREYFASGSTVGANGILLSLYDPGATPAVASVTLATANGVETPASFQGVPIAPGSLVVLHVGKAVPQQRTVATTVKVTGGKIVAGAMLSTVVDHKVLGALENGTPEAERAWYFGGSPAGGTTRQVLTVYNPSNSPSAVGVVFSGSAAKASADLTVPAGATTSFDAPSSNVHGVMSWVKIAAKRRSSPIVVGREVLVASAISNKVPVVDEITTCVVRGRRRRCRRGINATFALPRVLPAGFSTAAGIPTLARRWLIPGGESVGGTSEMLSLTNPGPLPAHVAILGLSGRAYGGLSDLVLAPGGAGALDLGRLLPGSRQSLPLVVRSDEPIVVNAALYRRGGRQAIGFSSFAAIPLK